MNIYVGNLPYTTTEDDLGNLFSAHGQVSRVSIIMDKMTGKSKGFGFVEMDDASEAETAINAINGMNLQGRNLRVNEARPRPERPARRPNY